MIRIVFSGGSCLAVAEPLSSSFNKEFSIPVCCGRCIFLSGYCKRLAAISDQGMIGNKVKNGDILNSLLFDII